MDTPLTARLGLTTPIIQAPMAGVSTAQLAGAVHEAGGLGSIAVGAMTAEAADRAIRQAMTATGGRLNVNLFVHPRPRRDPDREAAWLDRLAPYFGEFGAEPPRRLAEIYPTLDDAGDLLAVVLAHRPPVISLHFGLPGERTLKALRDSGARLLASATCETEARRLAAAGIDMIIAQGYEAGGHRGRFAAVADPRLTTSELLRRVLAAVDLPVIAAGGISDGRAIGEALASGAAGVQLGTAFVDCPESAAGAAYRQALRDPARTTAMTALFSGRPARGLVNRLVRETGLSEQHIPDYPLAYDAGKRLAAAATAAGSDEFTAMWAGSGDRRRPPLPAGALIRVLNEELARFSTSAQ